MKKRTRTWATLVGYCNWLGFGQDSLWLEDLDKHLDKHPHVGLYHSKVRSTVQEPFRLYQARSRSPTAHSKTLSRRLEA